MDAQNPFSTLTADELGRMAEQHGFKRKGQRNWLRRTADFVQLINLQKSQWSSDDHYLNFALWPLAMGDPPTVTESKFQFRTRAESMGAADLTSFFAIADNLKTLDELREGERSGRVTGLVTKELRKLLA